MLTDQQAIKLSAKPRSFVLGSSYRHPDLALVATPAEAINRAAQLCSPGYIWMEYRGHAAIVANYDGNGQVFNGQAQCVSAKPEDMIFLAHHAG